MASPAPPSTSERWLAPSSTRESASATARTIASVTTAKRAASPLPARFAVVTFAIVFDAALGLSRVLLRASHLSDVEGGAGLATAILALLGVLAIAVAHLRHNERPEP